MVVPRVPVGVRVESLARTRGLRSFRKIFQQSPRRRAPLWLVGGECGKAPAVALVTCSSVLSNAGSIKLRNVPRRGTFLFLSVRHGEEELGTYEVGTVAPLRLVKLGMR